MVERIEKNLYRIHVPLEGNPLRELNSYFIRGNDRDLLIDTGFRTRSCLAALKEGLMAINSDPTRRDVLITHFHADHAGLADLIAGENCCIYMSQVEYLYNNRDKQKKMDQKIISRFEKEGFGEERMARLMAIDSDNMTIPQFGARLRTIPPHKSIIYGDYQLENIPVPGHTPGNMMLWVEKQGIMFCGDHILFDISPNITPYADIEDSLGNYLNSLRKAQKYPVKLALPGHRESGEYHERILQLLNHHEQRLEEVRQIVQNMPGLCAYEIAQEMKWKIKPSYWDDFPVTQQWFATGECMAHLDHLRYSGNIDRRLCKNTYRYFENYDTAIMR